MRHLISSKILLHIRIENGGCGSSVAQLPFECCVVLSFIILFPHTHEPIDKTNLDISCALPCQR